MLQGSGTLLVQQPVSSYNVIPEIFYRESISEYGFPIKDFGNDELFLCTNLRVAVLVDLNDLEGIPSKTVTAIKLRYNVTTHPPPKK